MNDTETLSATLPDRLEEATRRLLTEACERGLKLATAESCTGGMLASLLTDVQCVAHVFERGFVTYSDESKTELLGVPKALIEEHGAVSSEVAIAMAEGALRRSRADVALATTGFADSGREPGLVYLAFARAGRATVSSVHQFGPIGRGGVRIATLDAAVDMMRQAL